MDNYDIRGASGFTCARKDNRRKILLIKYIYKKKNYQTTLLHYGTSKYNK